MERNTVESKTKPTVIVSKCLGFAPCRYNGAVIPEPFVRQLNAHVAFQPVCPEVEIGLGVPREPLRVVVTNGELRLMQPATGADYSQCMRDFVVAFLANLSDVDGFILKSRSPSCGIRDVKVYARMDKSAAVGKSAGFFGGAVLERFPHLAVEDEGRLTNWRIREHFLLKLFTLADFRCVKASGKMAELVRFHTRNKLLLMAYSQVQLKAMGAIVANPQRHPIDQVIAAYEQHLGEALTNLPRRNSAINVLTHALGYFSKGLTSREKAFFLETLEGYRVEKLPLSVPVGIIHSWIARFEEPYLAQQTFFQPYPEELVTIADSGKGRDF